MAPALVPWRCAKPITGQGKDDRHRSIEAYWQFLREAWKALRHYFKTRLKWSSESVEHASAEEELRTGLLESLNSTGRKFRLAESRQTVIKNGQRRIFQTAPDAKASVEHDFRFKLA